MFPANSHVIRPATAGDAMALRRLAAVSGVSPLTGRILVGEVEGIIAGALSREENRTMTDAGLAPGHLAAMLRLRAAGLAAVERQPSLAERIREAVLGRRQQRELPVAA